MAFLCVGGEHEGMALDTGALEHTFEPTAEHYREEKESYIRISAKGEGEFFMLAGMKPIDALKRWRELTGKPAPA